MNTVAMKPSFPPGLALAPCSQSRRARQACGMGLDMLAPPACKHRTHLRCTPDFLTQEKAGSTIPTNAQTRHRA